MKIDEIKKELDSMRRICISTAKQMREQARKDSEVSMYSEGVDVGTAIGFEIMADALNTLLEKID